MLMQKGIVLMYVCSHRESEQGHCAMLSLRRGARADKALFVSTNPSSWKVGQSPSTVVIQQRHLCHYLAQSRQRCGSGQHKVEQRRWCGSRTTVQQSSLSGLPYPNQGWDFELGREILGVL